MHSLHGNQNDKTKSVSTTPLTTTTKFSDKSVQESRNSLRNTLITDSDKKSSKGDKLFNVATVARRKSTDKVLKKEVFFFGFVPSIIIDNLKDSASPRAKTEALSTLQKIIDDRLVSKNGGIPINEEFEKLVGLLNKMLLDSNSLIIGKAMEIIHSLKVKILNCNNSNTVLQTIISLLQNKKIGIRKCSEELLKEFMKLVNHQKISSILFKSLMICNNENFYCLDHISSLIEKLSKEKPIKLSEYQFENSIAECYRIYNLEFEDKDENVLIKEKIDKLLTIFRSICNESEFDFLRSKYFKVPEKIEKLKDNEAFSLKEMKIETPKITQKTFETQIIEKSEPNSNQMIESNGKSENKIASTNDTISIKEFANVKAPLKLPPKMKNSNGLKIQGKATYQNQVSDKIKEEKNKNMTLDTFEQRLIFSLM